MPRAWITIGAWLILSLATVPALARPPAAALRGNAHFEPVPHSDRSRFTFRTAGIAGTVHPYGIDLDWIAQGANGPSRSTTLALEWRDGRDVNPEGCESLPGKTHYLVGPDPSRWELDVPHYAKICQRGLFAGVDVEVQLVRGELELSFHVAPGADPGAISWSMGEGTRLTRNVNGNLGIVAGDQTLDVRAPRAFQESEDGGLTEVPISYSVSGSQVRFEVGAYDSSRALLIDPRWSTVLGGDADDSANATVIAASGGGSAVYVAGKTSSHDFPGSETRPNSDSVVFVSKLSRTGSSVEFTTIFSPSGSVAFAHLRANAVGVDGAGNIFVAGGIFGADFSQFEAPGLLKQNPDSVDTWPPKSAGNGFVVKLSPDGTNVLYATLLGGAHTDEAMGLAVTASGEAVVCGTTRSRDFPTANAFDAVLQGADDPPDGFVSKINAAGTGLIYSTLFGGDSWDSLYDVELGSDGSAYAVGAATRLSAWGWLGTQTTVIETTGSSNFPVPAIVKVDASGQLQYATALDGGPTRSGIARAAAVNPRGELVAVGETNGVPTKNAYDATCGVSRPCGYAAACASEFQGQQSHCRDAFVSKLDADGRSLVFSTYLGGDLDDGATGVALGPEGHVYVAGFTTSFDFPTVGSAFETDSTRGARREDAIVAAFSADGKNLWYSSYHGGSESDGASAMAGDGGKLAVVGATRSADFPIADFDTTHHAADTVVEGREAFVSEFWLFPPAEAGSSGGWGAHFPSQQLHDSDIVQLLKQTCLTWNCGRPETWSYPTLEDSIPGRPGVRLAQRRLLDVAYRAAVLQEPLSKEVLPLIDGELAVLSASNLLDGESKANLQSQLRTLVGAKRAETALSDLVLAVNEARVEQARMSLGQLRSKPDGTQTRRFGKLATLHFPPGTSAANSLELKLQASRRITKTQRFAMVWPMIEFDFVAAEPVVSNGQALELQLDLTQLSLDDAPDAPRLLQVTGNDLVDVTRLYHPTTGRLVADVQELGKYVLVNDLTRPRPATAPAGDTPPVADAPPIEAPTCPEPKAAEPPARMWFWAAIVSMGLVVLLVARGLLRSR